MSRFGGCKSHVFELQRGFGALDLQRFGELMMLDLLELPFEVCVSCCALLPITHTNESMWCFDYVDVEGKGAGGADGVQHSPTLFQKGHF